MYSKKMLERYSAQIEDPQDRQVFDAGVSQIEFDELGNCVARLVEVHLMAVPHLRADFQERYLEFTKLDDLFPAQ